MKRFAELMVAILLFAIPSIAMCDVPYCGTFAALPYATKSQAAPRKCPPRSGRHYTRRYSGIGYEMLDSESTACFVPDAQYRLLDSLIDDVKRETNATVPLSADAARMVSATIGSVLRRNGFAFYTPIDTLSDALHERRQPDGSVLYIFDCDTSSIIYLTIAENLSLPAAMVEMILQHGDSDHDFIRWKLADGTSLDWDTNERSQCVLPPGQPAHVGRALTGDEMHGYMLSLRAELWKREKNFRRALQDFRRAVELYPESALNHNNLAWLIATTELQGRSHMIESALRHASRAVELVPKPNNLDTQACVYALAGNLEGARSTERAVIRSEPSDAFLKRLHMFEEGRDCTGQK